MDQLSASLAAWTSYGTEGVTARMPVGASAIKDAVATEIAVRAWRGELPLGRMIPEGHEDVSLELDANRIHLQVKSRRTHRGDFTVSELADAWRHLAELAAVDSEVHVGLVLERPLPGAETGLRHTVKDVADTGVNSRWRRL